MATLLTSEELSFILKAGEGTCCQAGKTSPEGDGMEINMKKALKITGILLALVILAALLVEFFFWPSYMLSEKRAVPGEDNDDEITVMSYNIRYFNPLDLGKRSWFYRASLVTEDVARVQPDIIGFQEVTWVHQGYLERTMEGYDSVVAYRDDFILSEGCPIFYRTDKYTKVSAGSFWISETPDQMTKIEGAEHYRVCIWIVLEDKVSGERISVFNAHLDSKGEKARDKGIDVVLDKINELGEGSVILMGDLNDTPDSKPIIKAAAALNDAGAVAPVRDEGYTYHAWGEKLDNERIDYIMVSGDASRILEYRRVDNLHGDVYASDHAPIYVKLRVG